MMHDQEAADLRWKLNPKIFGPNIVHKILGSVGFPETTNFFRPKCQLVSDVQIELMLKMGVKAEIQCLYTISHNFLTNVYLPNKLQYGGWI